MRVSCGLSKGTILVLSVGAAGGCRTVTRRAATVDVVAAKVCPTAHEVEEVPALTVETLTGVIEAQVGDDRRGLPDVAITLTRSVVPDEGPSYHANSGKDGSFSLKGIQRGKYLLTACKPGFVTLRGPVTIRPGAASPSVTLTTRLDW
jgi:hypothetical protein